MSSSRALMKQSKTFSARLAGSCKKDCWLIPGLAMWLFATFLAVSSGYAGITCMIFEHMYKTQPNPYLDEVFHIPQARKYCDGNFTQWDPKITTLPGLYLLTIGILKPLSWILSKPDLCSSVYALRCVNMVLSTGLLYVVYSLLRQIHGQKDELDVVRGLLTAVNLSIFPILYFFNFLYYTDVMSTFLVLLAYLLCLHERHIASAFTGLLAVCVRQTNIVWVGFFGLLTFANVLRSNAYINRKKFSTRVVRSYKYLEMLWMNSCQVALLNTSAGIVLGRAMVRKLTGYILVGVAFIIFVAWNGSIVVGDKQAHQATLHFCQILYFSAFFLFFMLPISMPYTFLFHNVLRRKFFTILISLLLIIGIVHFNTIAHPYLLADNRHYTFYIWRRIIDREWWTRYAIIPIYLLGCSFIASILKCTDFVFQVGFVCCLIASVVPQSLLEFRYFIIPYMMLRLHVLKPAIWQLLFEMALYILVNAVIIMMFSFKTIQWSDMEEPQRFLW